MALANCPRCGRLFDNSFKDICQYCTKEEEELYQKVRLYVKENRKCTIYECSDDTEVPIKTIARFIKQGRINLKNNPNMMYPCETCGAPISTGRYCSDCSGQLTKGFKEISDQHKEEQKQQRLKEDKKMGYHFDDFKKK